MIPSMVIPSLSLNNEFLICDETGTKYKIIIKILQFLYDLIRMSRDDTNYIF